jgi:hypothetical protein
MLTLDSWLSVGWVPGQSLELKQAGMCFIVRILVGCTAHHDWSKYSMHETVDLQHLFGNQEACTSSAPHGLTASHVHRLPGTTLLSGSAQG